MSMSSLFRPLLLLFCFLGASNAFAENTYYYRYEPDVFYISLSSACQALFDRSVTPSSNMAVIEVTASYSGSSCYYRYTLTGDTTVYVSGFIVDGKTPIIDGKTCQAGQSKTLSWPMGRDLPPDGYQDFGTIYPATACFSGCNSTYDGSGSEPYTVPGSEGSDIVYIDATYTLDGSACAASSAEPGAPSIPPAPESDPCVTDPASCDPDPGGGDTGGGDTGGGDTGGGDTGGGDTGGGDTGGGDTTVDPTPGDGTQPGEPGIGTGDSVASGMACDQPTVCQGDAIQCAILAQQKAQRCSDVESENYAAQEGAIKSLVDGPEFELEQSQVSAPSLLDQHGRFLPSASCPPPESFSLNSNGGHSFQFSYEPICTMATDLSWLIVAFATLSAALYIGRSFGGG